MPRNPLKVDPTRTLMIRQRWMADIKRRFNRLKKKVREFLVEKDALGLKERTPFAIHVQEREFAFLTDPGKLEAFNRWFAQQVEAEVFSVPPGTPPDEPWTAEYVESAYKRGQLNAFFSSKKAELIEPVSDSEKFLRESFMAPEAMSKVRLLATRSLESLRGVTADMASRMNFILAQGMIEGRGPLDIAQQMTEEIDGLTFRRAFVIARTETIHAHAEGQLDAFEKLGVKELGVQAEWTTAGDDRVCPECAKNEGKRFSIDEARGLIPLHPNCRCTWIPAVD